MEKFDFESKEEKKIKKYENCTEKEKQDIAESILKKALDNVARIKYKRAPKILAELTRIINEMTGNDSKEFFKWIKEIQERYPDFEIYKNEKKSYFAGSDIREAELREARERRRAGGDFPD